MVSEEDVATMREMERQSFIEARAREDAFMKDAELVLQEVCGVRALELSDDPVGLAVAFQRLEDKVMRPYEWFLAAEGTVEAMVESYRAHCESRVAGLRGPGRPRKVAGT